MNFAGVCTSVELKIERRGWIKVEVKSEVCVSAYVRVCMYTREDYINQCVHQLISVSTWSIPCFNFNDILDRLQCHVATRTSTWLQGLWCEAPPIQHHQTRHLGDLSRGGCKHVQWGMWHTRLSRRFGVSFSRTSWWWSPWAIYAGYANRTVLPSHVLLIALKERRQQ